MKTSNGTAHRRRQRRCNGHGYRLAVVRALTAGGLIINGTAPPGGAAAQRCGSKPAHRSAAVALLPSENKELLPARGKGPRPLLEAARETQRLSVLVSAYREASASDRVNFAKAVGPTVLFDTALVPAL